MSGFGGSYAAAFGAVSARQRDMQRAEDEAAERSLRSRQLDQQAARDQASIAETNLRIQAAQDALEERQRIAKAGAERKVEESTQPVELPGPNPNGAAAGVSAQEPVFRVDGRNFASKIGAQAAAMRLNAPGAQARRMAAELSDPVKRFELNQQAQAMERDGTLRFYAALQAGHDKRAAAIEFNKTASVPIDPDSLQVETFEKEYRPGSRPRRTARVTFKDQSGQSHTIDDTFGSVLAMLSPKEQLAADHKDRELELDERRIKSTERLNDAHVDYYDQAGRAAAMNAARLLNGNPGEGRRSALPEYSPQHAKAVAAEIDAALPETDIAAINRAKDPAGYAAAELNQRHRRDARTWAGRIFANSRGLQDTAEYLNPTTLADLSIRVATGKADIRSKIDKDRGVVYRYVEQDGRRFWLDQRRHVPQSEPPKQPAEPTAQSIPERPGAPAGSRQAPVTAVAADHGVKGAGKQLVAVCGAAESPRATLQRFGLRQRRAKPQEYALARAARESALRDLQTAEQAYQAVVGGGQTGQGFGALQRP